MAGRTLKSLWNKAIEYTGIEERRLQEQNCWNLLLNYSWETIVDHNKEKHRVLYTEGLSEDLLKEIEAALEGLGLEYECSYRSGRKCLVLQTNAGYTLVNKALARRYSDVITVNNVDIV